MHLFNLIGNYLCRKNGVSIHNFTRPEWRVSLNIQMHSIYRLIWNITLTSLYWKVNQTRTGMQHMMRPETARSILRMTQFSDNIQGLSSTHVSQPTAHGRHSKDRYLLSRHWNINKDRIEKTAKHQQGYSSNFLSKIKNKEHVSNSWSVLPLRCFDFCCVVY